MSPGTSSSTGPSPRKARWSWFPYVIKLQDTYSVRLGYKSTRGKVSEFSAAKENGSTKIPFDTPVLCQYTMATESGESFPVMQVTSKRREVRQLRMNHLNCFEAGNNNAFSRRVSAMVVDKREELLAQFLTLLSYSKDFSSHREDVHTDEGEELDDVIDNDGLLSSEDMKNEYGMFRRAAIESAKIVDRQRADIRQYLTIKRKADGSASGGTGPKKSELTVVKEKERKELEDETGLEKEYQKSYIGFAHIPLENIEIAPDLVNNLNEINVDVIVQSIIDKYDPAQAIPVICPEDNQEAFDIKKHANHHKFVAVQKIHLVAAFKKLDKEGKFATLRGHSRRTVPCYVLNISGSGLIHYGNMRANDIGSQFSRETMPQDLLRTFYALSSKEGSESAQKVIDRMASLAKIGLKEISALKKLCNWTNPNLAALMEVLSWYERYESMDPKPKGYQQSLAQGKKMIMPRVLFRQLGKINEQFFFENYQKILKNESSLKTCLDDFELCNKMDKVTAALSMLAEYKPYENLKLEYPGKFEFENLKHFFGADIKKDGVKNKEAIELQIYFEKVVHGQDEDKLSVHIVQFQELTLLLEDQILESYPTVIIDVNKDIRSETDAVLDLLQRRVLVKTKEQATIALFPTEECQFRALSSLRNSGIVDMKVKPLFFNGYAHESGDFTENLRCGVLFGSFAIISPLNMYYDSLSDIHEIILKICPDGSNIAFVSGSAAQLTCLSSKGVKIEQANASDLLCSLVLDTL